MVSPGRAAGDLAGAVLATVSVLQFLLGSVHLVADVLGDRLVQVLLLVGELIRDRVGAALWNSGLPSKVLRSSLTMRRIRPSALTAWMPSR